MLLAFRRPGTPEGTLGTNADAEKHPPLCPGLHETSEPDLDTGRQKYAFKKKEEQFTMLLAFWLAWPKLGRALLPAARPPLTSLLEASPVPAVAVAAPLGAAAVAFRLGRVPPPC